MRPLAPPFTPRSIEMFPPALIIAPASTLPLMVMFPSDLTEKPSRTFPLIITSPAKFMLPTDISTSPGIVNKFWI